MLAATNYAAIIRPLQFLVLVLAALFFLRVLRAAVLEMQPEKEEGEKRRRRRRLALEFLEPDSMRGERREDTVAFQDVGSTNGTYVNAEPVIYRTQLLKNDVVQIGNTIMEVVR